jgi:hypothetical protein
VTGNRTLVILATDLRMTTGHRLQSVISVTVSMTLANAVRYLATQVPLIATEGGAILRYDVVSEHFQNTVHKEVLILSGFRTLYAYS